MEQLLVVISVMSKITLPKAKLENDVNNRKRHCKLNFTDILLPGYENITWHFTPLEASGNVEIVIENKQSDTLTSLEVPVTTSFVAGCTKRIDDKYRLASAVSLS
jgi:hypothetical protein